MTAPLNTELPNTLELTLDVLVNITLHGNDDTFNFLYTESNKEIMCTLSSRKMSLMDIDYLFSMIGQQVQRIKYTTPIVELSFENCIVIYTTMDEEDNGTVNAKMVFSFERRLRSD